MTAQNLSFSIETITPQIASEYLKRNVCNRPLSNNTVLLYAGEMKAGNWRENPTEPISFTIDGTLLDGQHRLTAVEKSGVTVNMAVVRGASPKDFEIINTGRGRHFSDVLAFVGAKDYVPTGTSIKYYFELLRSAEATGNSQSAKSMHITNERVLNEYRSSPDLYEEICRLASRIYDAGRFLKKGEVGGISIYLIKAKHHDIEKVQEFWFEITKGAKWRVLSYLRTRLVSSATAKHIEQKLTTQAKRVLISKAWNLFIAGEDQKQLSYRLGDKYHFD